MWNEDGSNIFTMSLQPLLTFILTNLLQNTIYFLEEYDIISAYKEANWRVVMDRCMRLTETDGESFVP